MWRDKVTYLACLVAVVAAIVWYGSDFGEGHSMVWCCVGLVLDLSGCAYRLGSYEGQYNR